MPEKVKRRIVRPVMIPHDVGQDDTGAPRHPRETVYIDVGDFAVFLDKVQTFVKMVDDREVVTVVGLDSLVEGDLLGWVEDGGLHGGCEHGADAPLPK